MKVRSVKFEENTNEKPVEKLTSAVPFAPYYFPIPCLAFKWCHAPFDTVKACYNCAFNQSCDTFLTEKLPF